MIKYCTLYSFINESRPYETLSVSRITSHRPEDRHEWAVRYMIDNPGLVLVKVKSSEIVDETIESKGQ